MNTYEQCPQLILNASLVTDEACDYNYEFVLDEDLQAIECGEVISVSQAKLFMLDNFEIKLKHCLFELNHVRIYPELDNVEILGKFREALLTAGVEINNIPDKETLAICYKPLGELSDTVRFYVEPDGNVIFLSSSVRLKVI